MKRSDARSALLTAAALAAALPVVLARPAVAQKALFLAKEVPQDHFILVAAPIGSGERAQLNIYEQLNDRRPCFSTSGVDPAVVNPLLGTFDFTGICNRFIDANGYSLRIGEADLATNYRISVVREKADTVLLAIPLKSHYGPELLIARTHGPGQGFLQLRFEPGWMLKRRFFGPRALGHVYIYRDGAAADTATTPAAAPAAQAPAAPAPAAPAAAAPAATAPVTTPAPATATPTATPAAKAPQAATPAAPLPKAPLPKAPLPKAPAAQTPAAPAHAAKAPATPPVQAVGATTTGGR